MFATPMILSIVHLNCRSVSFSPICLGSTIRVNQWDVCSFQRTWERGVGGGGWGTVESHQFLFFQPVTCMSLYSLCLLKRTMMIVNPQMDTDLQSVLSMMPVRCPFDPRQTVFFWKLLIESRWILKWIMTPSITVGGGRGEWQNLQC